MGVTSWEFDSPSRHYFVLDTSRRGGMTVTSWEFLAKGESASGGDSDQRHYNLTFRKLTDFFVGGASRFFVTLDFLQQI